MNAPTSRPKKNKLITSYASVVVSITLVLFMLGILITLVYNATQISTYVKESFTFTIFLKNEAKKSDVSSLQKTLALSEYVKSTEYISKEEAKERLSQDLDEDFVSFLGTNPLLNSLEVRFQSEYATPAIMKKVEESLVDKEFIDEIIYDQSLITAIWDNVRIITVWMLIISGIFGFASVVLINNAIRLSLYSNRFMIKTMQLVGANRKFISRPFVRKSLQLGFYSAVVALVLLGVLVYYFEANVSGFVGISDRLFIGVLLALLVFIGCIIPYISTRVALRKFLNTRIEELY